MCLSTEENLTLTRSLLGNFEIGGVNFSTQFSVTQVRVFGSYLSEDIFNSENQLYGLLRMLLLAACATTRS